MSKLLYGLMLAAALSLTACSRDDRNSADIPGAEPAAETRPQLPFDRIEIRGSAVFTARTKEALALLGSSATFPPLSPYLAVIEESTRSGMVAWAEKPVFQVGGKTWNSGAAWYAGAIAHDSCHSRIYHTAARSPDGRVPDDGWSGKKAEQQCLAVQAEVLTEIKADERYIKYVKDLIPNPAYQNIPYSSRTW